MLCLSLFSSFGVEYFSSFDNSNCCRFPLPEDEAGLKQLEKGEEIPSWCKI